MDKLKLINVKRYTEEELAEVQRRWMAMLFVNDLAFWYPKLKEIGMLTPKTEYFRTDVEFMHFWDGKTPDGFDAFEVHLKEVAGRMGYPCFMRTGHTSGKHDGACFIESEAALDKKILQLAEFSGLVDMPTNTWVIRERLQLEAHFNAFNALPINRERRYFFEDGEVICHHPYWIPDAIHSADNDNWEELLEMINHEPSEEIIYLTELTRKVAKHFSGAWSIDWAKTDSGEWYAIDMAQAGRSYHWDGCKNERKQWKDAMAEVEYSEWLKTKAY